ADTMPPKPGAFGPWRPISKRKSAFPRSFWTFRPVCNTMDPMSDRPSFAVRFWPLVAAVLLIAVDQFTKALIIQSIPVDTIAWKWGNDFFWLMHQRNTGVA